MEREIIREKTLCTDIKLILIGTGARQTTFSASKIFPHLM